LQLIVTALPPFPPRVCYADTTSDNDTVGASEKPLASTVQGRVASKECRCQVVIQADLLDLTQPLPLFLWREANDRHRTQVARLLLKGGQVDAPAARYAAGQGNQMRSCCCQGFPSTCLCIDLTRALGQLPQGLRHGEQGMQGILCALLKLPSFRDVATDVDCSNDVPFLVTSRGSTRIGARLTSSRPRAVNYTAVVSVSTSSFSTRAVAHCARGSDLPCI
jgi:hypothetical protein